METKKGLFYALETIREMVDEFCSVHYDDWEKINEAYKAEHGFNKGAEHLSIRSYIGSDLLIDFSYLARDVELGGPFTNEYWIRSQGTQCIRNERDREANKLWSDVLAKISVTYDGNEFTDIHWVEDDDCLIKNRFVAKDVLYSHRISF